MNLAYAIGGLVCLGVATSGLVTGQQYVISTIAGGSSSLVAEVLGEPFGLVVDGSGNVYYSEPYSVWKVDQSRVVTRFAGNGRQGHRGDGGPATSAELSDAGSLAVDGAGNLYIADGDRVRRVSASGIITTVAGGGTGLYTGDPAAPGVPATAVGLSIETVYYGGGIAVDGLGNLLIAQTAGLLRVAPSGIVSKAASLQSQGPLAVDRSGNIFIGQGSEVLRISPDGLTATVAGTGKPGFSGDGGQATKAELSFVFGLAVNDSGDVFIADTTRIRKVSTGGIITTVAGGGSASPADGTPATAVQLAYNIMNIAVDTAQNLFIADVAGLYEVTPDGNIAAITARNDCCSVGDGGPAVAAELRYPSDLAVDRAGNLFIADTGNARVRKVSPAGVITTVAGDGRLCTPPNFADCAPVDGITAATAHLGAPSGLAVDGIGTLFIADRELGLVRKVSPDGIITTVAGGGALGDGGQATSARLADPIRVAVDPSGNLYITEDARIRKVVVDGTITTIAGDGVENFSGDGGPASNAELDPDDASGQGAGGGLAFDGAGDLLIADTYNNVVRQLSSGGRIDTVAGVGTNSIYGDSFSGDDGSAVNAHLSLPWGVAFDGAGSFFVADAGNSRIRKISPSGIITTVAGTGAAGFSGDGGPGTGAALGQLGGITGDGAGNVYFVDGNSVRVLRPTNRAAFVEAVVDAASQQAAPVSPGKIVVIYGAGLGPAQLIQNQASNGQLGTAAGGTVVSFNGIAAPILYASDAQVAAVVPYAMNGMSAQVTVSYQGETSDAFPITVVPASPSLFTLNQTGAGQAAAINASDGTPNNAANPVKPGDFISLYATGEGQTSPPGVDGKLGASDGARPVLPVSATVGGLPATVQYQGGVSGQVAGLMQVNVQIPTGVQSGGYVPVVLQVGDVSSTPGAVWIAVSGN